MTNIFREKSAQEEDADLQRKIDAIKRDIKGDSDELSDDDLKRKIDEIRASIREPEKNTTRKGGRVMSITVEIKHGKSTIYGGTIEIESKKDAEKLADDVRESIAEILTKYYSREKPEAE